MINEVAIVMTFPSLLQWDGGGGHFRKTTIHSSSPFNGSRRSRSDNLPSSQNGSCRLLRVPNTFQIGKGKGRG